MATKAAKVAGIAIASAAVGAAPPASEAIPEIEPNDTFLTAQSVGAAGTIDGSLREATPDLADYFSYSLTPGDLFDFFVEQTDALFDSEDLLAQALSSAQLAIDSEQIPPGSSLHLQGTVPSDGQVIVSLTLPTPGGPGGAEEYRITLNTRTVPVPASLALVAAGLVGLGGVHVARRRRAD